MYEIVCACVCTCCVHVVPGAPPVNLELLVFNATALSVTWHPPAFEDRNGVIIHYALNVTLLSKAVTHRYLTASTFKLLTSLHPYYSYECSVAAVTSVGHGPYATQSIRMPETCKYSNWASCTMEYCAQGCICILAKNKS